MSAAYMTRAYHLTATKVREGVENCKTCSPDWWPPGPSSALQFLPGARLKACILKVTLYECLTKKVTLRMQQGDRLCLEILDLAPATWEPLGNMP